MVEEVSTKGKRRLEESGRLLVCKVSGEWVLTGMKASGKWLVVREIQQLFERSGLLKQTPPAIDH